MKRPDREAGRPPNSAEEFDEVFEVQHGTPMAIEEFEDMMVELAFLLWEQKQRGNSGWRDTG